MDLSVSPHSDSSGSVTDGDEDLSEAGPSPAAPPQGWEAAESPGVTIVQLSDGETVQVSGVVQAPQTSVIQSPQVQAVQISTVAELGGDVPRRREILSRRPSYRKILNELSSDPSAVHRIDEERSEEEVAAVPPPTTVYQTSSGQYITFSQGRAMGADPAQGAQTLTAGQPGDFYIQGGQVLIQAATGDIPAYQLRSPNSGLAQSIVMAASPGGIQNPTSHHAEEVTRKREVRLMKNREAARECRRKKKEYVKCLENRVAVLENQNKTLIEELKALKDIYCHKAE